MLVDIDIIIRVFMKKPHKKYLKIGGERPQLKVPIVRIVGILSFLLFLSCEEL